MAIWEDISERANIKCTRMCTGRLWRSRNREAANGAHVKGWEERVIGQVQNTKHRALNPQKAVVFNTG